LRTPPNVNVENPGIFRFSCLIERARPFHARIVKRNVELAEFVDSELDHRLDVGVFRNIRADECCLAAKRPYFVNDFRAFFFATTAHHCLRAGASELYRRRFADAGSSSGHEDNFTFECFAVVHWIHFLWLA
jgi:hypothetical protein